MSSVTNTATNWYFCAAPGCSSDDRKKGRYGYMQDVQFFAFPSKKKAPIDRRKWLDLLRRDNFDPSRKARVCSLHFVDRKPTEKHPFPELFMHNNFKESKMIRPNTAITKREHAFELDKENNNCKENPQTCNDNEITPMMVDCVTEEASVNSNGLNGCWPVANEVEIAEMETVTCNPMPEKIAMDHSYTGVRAVFSCVESSTQTDLKMTDIGAMEQRVKELDDPDKLLRDLFEEKVTKDDSSIRHYTGIPSKKILDGAFDILTRASPDLKYWSGQTSSTKKGYQTGDVHQPKKTGPKRKLTRYQEFLLTLVRLRLALTTFLLGDLFGVSASRVSQIFTTWINYMAVTFTPLLKWPSQDVIKRFRPGSFKLNFQM
ncbi:uncharacterized protein LOC130049438 [Ostrea edulis]|uniref:uncharacterized protein LOC130049438 n=1 Tax=Ostrea edulis TaxID=37623 RepID=UPI0024AF4384|nr:uncharacterized protein LOC130049438 [Ostrea edulis]